MTSTPRLDAILTLSPALYAAQRRVTWQHYAALLDQGIPARELARDGLFTFGIVRIQGREMLVTEDTRLRSYFYGPGLFALPPPVERAVLEAAE